RNNLTVLATFKSPLCQFGVFTVDFGKGFLFLAKEARILYLSAIGERSERLESHINANLRDAFRQAFWFHLTGERDVPFTSRRPLNGTGLDLASDGAVIDQLDMPNAKGIELVLLVNLEPRLREREAVISALALEAWEPRLFDVFSYATEKGFECQVNSYRDVLQDLGMDVTERRSFLFQYREGVDLLIKRQALACLLVGLLAHCKQVVIQPTALFKRLVEFYSLFFGRIETVLKHFMHSGVVAQNRWEVKRE